MSRAEKVAEAQRLRAEGLLLREIAERMGSKTSTVHAWLVDPDLSKHRARRKRYAGTCGDCGGPTDGSDGPSKAAKRCTGCAARHQHEQRYWTRERVVTELQAWALELGRIPTATDALTRGARVYAVAAQREFGSWSNALRAAGMEPNRPALSGDAFKAACAEAARLYAEGHSSGSIARIQGIADTAAQNRLRRAGVKLRSYKEAAALRRAA